MKFFLRKKTGNSINKILLVTCISSLFSTSITWAQNCKPDYSKMDKIEKKQIDAWYAELYETGLGGSMIKTSEVSITLAIGREDTTNDIQVILIKRESSDVNQGFESSLKGAKGDEFFFGIKGGDPLKFVATEVSNQTKREALSGKLNTTVNLSSKINSGDLKTLKNVLAANLIDAVRIKLENDLVIEQSVKEKHARKFMEKADCFFNWLQEKGLLRSEKNPEDVKSKLPDKDKENKNVKVTATQKTKSSSGKTNDDNISKSEVMPKYEAADNGEQFEGVWTSETKKKSTLTIIKINSNNYEVKQILKVGPFKKNASPCPTFELINGELICKQFKIIYLPEKSSIYYDGNEYKKE